jgi:small subunit ribosomal protein S3
MGQKVSPHGLRVGVIKDWDSKWYANKNEFADYLVEDNKVRAYVKKKLYAAGVAKVVIERSAANNLKVIIMTAKPGMVIGRSGDGVEELKKELVKLTNKTVEISIEEVKKAELDAQLSAESIAQALERRVSFRRAMKQAIGRTMKGGAKGIKVLCSGRLGGAEIARNEKYSEGNVPLHTLRADIDYGFAEADTQYGKIGVKVWINHGEILDKGLKSSVPSSTKSDRKERKGGRKNTDRKRNFDRKGDRFNKEVKAPVKPATTRVRKAPKVEPQVEEQAVSNENAETEA